MQWGVLLAVVTLSLVVSTYMLWAWFKLPRAKALSSRQLLALVATGLVAFIADTVGIGSFAVEIALLRFFNCVDDQALPGVVNAAQVLPGALESFFFLKMVAVDPWTLFILVSGACCGGVIGGTVVSRLRQHHIQITMAWAFVILALIIGLDLLGWLPFGGHATALTGTKLWCGFFGMMLAGILPAFGVGLFALVELLLFFLGLSPLVAFPIMTTAGALQQPLTTVAFAMNGAIEYRKMFLVSFAGIVGVLLTVPLVTQLSPDLLHGLLLLVVAYNAVRLFQAYYNRSSRVPA